MTIHTDPWASTDHDPTSNIQYLSAASTLALARADIHHAVDAADDPHRRCQYALSARDYAAEVLLAPGASPAQRECAGFYLADAEAFIAST